MISKLPILEAPAVNPRYVFSVVPVIFLLVPLAPSSIINKSPSTTVVVAVIPSMSKPTVTVEPDPDVVIPAPPVIVTAPLEGSAVPESVAKSPVSELENVIAPFAFLVTVTDSVLSKSTT